MLTVREDQATKGLRLHAAILDGELKMCPVWTAFGKRPVPFHNAVLFRVPPTCPKFPYIQSKPARPLGLSLELKLRAEIGREANTGIYHPRQSNPTPP